jgi:hypothetical protein
MWRGLLCREHPGSRSSCSPRLLIYRVIFISYVNLFSGDLMLLPFRVWFNNSACDEMLNNMCDGSVSPVINIFSGIHIMIITLFWKTQAVELVCLPVPEWPFLLRI